MELSHKVVGLYVFKIAVIRIGAKYVATPLDIMLSIILLNFTHLRYGLYLAE